MQAISSFQASITIPSLNDKKIDIQVDKGQNIKDIVYHLIQQYAIPPYLTSSLYSSILSAMSDSCRSIQKPMDKQIARQLFTDAYQSNTLQYNNKPEEDIFPRAYHTLVHCPISHIFDTLLELEQSYAIAIQELQVASDQELAAIQARQSQEIESASTASTNTSIASPQPSSSNNNMTTIFTRQVEEMEVFQATWQSDILQTQQTQRQEYREFVIELYREYQSRLASLSDEQHIKPEDIVVEKKLDGKEMVSVAAGRVKQWEKDTKSASSSSSRRSRTGSLASSLNSTDDIKSIQEMGFQRNQAETALILSNQNLEAAIALLLENPDKVDAYIAEKPYRRSHSLSQVPRPNIPSSPTHNRHRSNHETPRRHSFQKFASTASFLNVLNNKNSQQQQQQQQQQNSQQQPQQQKSWNPISFLHQQKQALENTNLSSVRKLGGWLGRAMENFGIEEEKSKLLMRQQQSYQQPQLVESFSIMMGTAQVKSSHNLRLLVTDESTEIFHPLYDPAREMAYRAETSTKLYTSHLSAAIVLVELNELKNKGWSKYKAGKGSNKALFERCQQSTEFHFPDMESQLALIEQDIEHGLVEGTFFITKHSNLPSTQVIFHLLIDSTAITTQDVSNRHPLIAGLRNILKITSHYDISSLSIPLLLLPDRWIEQPEQHQSNNEQHMTWLSKRGEVVMKCVKGFLIENSRNNKTRQNDDRLSETSGGIRNIEFLLPVQPNIYTVGLSVPSPITTQPETNNTEQTIPHEVEITFQQFRTLLVNLFRTS